MCHYLVFVILALLQFAQVTVADCSGWQEFEISTDIRCCSSGNVNKFTYQVDGEDHNDWITYQIETKYNDNSFSDTVCEVKGSNNCEGDACSSSWSSYQSSTSTNNCYSSGIVTVVEPQQLCLSVDCKNSFAKCNGWYKVEFEYLAPPPPPPVSSPPPSPSPPPTASSPPPSPPPACPTSSDECDTACDTTSYQNGHSWSWSSSSGGTCTCYDSSMNTKVFDDCVEVSPPPPTPSPPPTPATPPPEQTESADTSQNCKCSCCTGNYCSASIVASYDAESSSECGSADCRSRFSTLCPASGESGSVSASYSESTISSSSSTTPTAPASSSDAAGLNVYASSLAAVGISLMLAC